MHYFSNLFDRLHVSDKSTVHHQEYIHTIDNCHASSASVVRTLTTLADANRTSMTNTYCVYAVLRYS